jgi:hypothetical protein
MTARDARGGELARPRRIAPLSDDCAALVDVGIFLEPHGRHARLTLVKDFDRFPARDVPLVIEGGALRLPREDEPPPADASPGSFTMLAIGSAGAEEEFGACAERWGVREVNFTFRGRHEIARTRGLVELTDDDLRVGEVSAAYVKAHMHAGPRVRPGAAALAPLERAGLGGGVATRHHLRAVRRRGDAFPVGRGPRGDPRAVRAELRGAAVVGGVATRQDDVAHTAASIGR